MDVIQFHILAQLSPSNLLSCSLVCSKLRNECNINPY
ncbi:MAG: F-box protein [Parachlamydiaceae bacterium]|nr:F-box protein [Parachlamydiaceae bacterium]